MSRQDGIAKARAIKTARAKGKIQTAINVLMLYNAKLTVRAIADEAGVSKNTVQKYMNNIENSKNIMINSNN